MLQRPSHKIGITLVCLLGIVGLAYFFSRRPIPETNSHQLEITQAREEIRALELRFVESQRRVELLEQDVKQRRQKLAVPYKPQNLSAEELARQFREIDL